MNATVAVPPTAAAGLPPSLSSTFGAILLGGFVGTLMYGLTLHQTYGYFRTYAKDVTLLKLMVAALYLLDTLHSVCCVHLSYHYLVVNYFNPPALEVGVWSIRVLTPTINAIFVICQLFYTRRIWLICPRRVRIFVVPIAIAFIVGSFAFSCVATVAAFKAHFFDDFVKSAWKTSAAFAFTMAAEVVLTTTLVIYLKTHRSGIRRTDSMMNALVLYTINTGLLTCTLSFFCLLFAFIHPDNLIYVALDMPTTKAYVNSVLTVLNSRKALKDLGKPGANGFETFAFTTLQHVEARSGSQGHEGGMINRVIEYKMPRETTGSETAVSEGPWSRSEHATIPHAHFSKPIGYETASS